MALTNNTNVWKFISIIIIALFALFYTLYVFSGLFIVFIFGIILITISEKSMNFYNKLFSGFTVPKWLKTSIGYILVCIFLIFAISLISSSVVDIFQKFQDPIYGNNPLKGIYNQNIEPYLPNIIKNNVITENNLQKISNSVFNFASSGLSEVGSFIFQSLLIIPLMFAIYFKKRENINKNISNFVPKKFHNATKNALNDIGKQMKDYFSAKVLESTVIGFICAIGFYFLNLEGWLFLGVLAGFLNIVPYIGPVLGAILPIFVSITHNIHSTYWTIGIIVFAQLVDNFYLIPFTIADKVKLDSLLSLVLILVASQLFGAFGMIFIIPFYLISKIILTSAYRELSKVYDK